MFSIELGEIIHYIEQQELEGHKSHFSIPPRIKTNDSK
jgi:hypothetical protein